MKRRLLAVTLCAALPWLAACSPRDSSVGRIAADQAAPAVDVSSPQATLKSYWATLDWYGGRFVVGRAEPDPAGRDLFLQAMRPLVVASVLDNLSARMPKGERLIGTVGDQHKENDSTVDVRAQIKSLAQHEAALTPTPVELFAGESFGGQFRYRLVRQSDSWKVAEVWREDPGSQPRQIR